MAKAAAGVTTIPVSVTVQPGVRKDLPQAQIPAGVTHASFSLDASWFTDPTALLSWGADTSTDGATWSFFASGSRPGGRALGDGGVVVTTLDLGFTVTPGQFVRGFLLLTPGTQPQGPQPITGTLTLTQMAIAFVQSKSVDSGSVSSANLAFTSNVTAGSLVVVALRISGHGLFTSVTDSVSGSYSTANGPRDDLLGEDCFIVYAPNAAGGATTVTVTLSSAASLRWAIHEYSGVATATPLDKNGGQANASTTTPVSPSVTTTSANELIFGYVDDGSSTGVTLTPTAPYNKREELLVGGALKLTTFDKIVAAAAAYTAGGTWNASSAGASQIATFVQAAATTLPPLPMIVDTAVARASSW